MATQVIILSVLVLFAAFALYAIRALGTSRSRSTGTTSEASADENDTKLNFLVRTRTLPWMEVAQHVKLGEFLQLSGRTVSGGNFTLIFQIQASRKIDLISVRVARVSIRCEGGQESIATVTQNGSLVIFTPTDAKVEFQNLEGGTETPQDYIKNDLFTLVISYVASLTIGNSIHIAARASNLESKFIKAWDIPAASSDNAILAEMSITADLAHFSERIKDFQQANSATGGSDDAHFDLKTGVCYVLGHWGGENLEFHGAADCAILVVEAFDPATSLSAFLSELSVSPSMHARLVNRISTTTQRIEPMLICPNPGSGDHEILRLYESNVLLMMKASDGSLVEVLKVKVDRDPSLPVGNHVSFTYFPSDSFQNVLVWRLPPKPAPEPRV